MAFKKKIKEDTPQDRHFYPYRIPRTETAKALIADVLIQLQRYEKHEGLLKRRRKPSEQKTLEATVTAIISDVIHRWRTDHFGEAYVAVPFSNRELGRAGRYRSPVLNKMFRKVIERLSSPALLFIEFQKGYFYPFGVNRQSTIRAGKSLITRIDEMELSTSDFTSALTQEVIILKRNKADIFDEGEWIEYEDTEETRRYREEMLQINTWLAEADISVIPLLAVVVQNVDGANRILRRYFNNGSFEQGGRLFGGFWQNMEKKTRREGILIRGEQIVTLDFSQMNPRLLYAKAGLTPPEGDMYGVPVWGVWRAGLKKIFNVLINVDKRPVKFPPDTKHLFYEKARIGNIVDAILKFHKPINSYFFTRVGLELMFLESKILVDILLQLKERNIVALPVHDAVIVAESASKEAYHVMVEAFERHTGLEGKVDIEA